MIAAIFAVDEAGSMGWKGSLPWPHNKDHISWFNTASQNQIIAMGRNTWDSPDLPTPLAGRLNVVFTSKFFDNDDIEQIKGDVCEALKSIKHYNRKKNIFVIGGPNILNQAKPVLEKVYIARIPGEFLSDVTLNVPEFLKGMSLHQTINLGSCVIEEYHNDTI